MLVAGLIAAVPPSAGRLGGQVAGEVEGTVMIAGGGGGFPGVRVRVADLRREVVTDANGSFQLGALPAGSHEIRADAIGCRAGSWTVEVVAGERVSLHLTVDGPAFREPGEEAARSATVLSNDDPFTVERLGREELRHDPGQTIADLIRGAFPGVKIVQGSGMPGSTVSIQFRGPTSISGSQEPLVVVDGMITGGGLDGLDPRDVESLEILKGSAASAIYGARGQAGVIEITTAQGRPTAPAACFFRSEPSR